MALADDEKRLLAAIERALLKEDPQLASLFAEQRMVSPARFAWAVFGTIVMLSAGSALMVIGVKMAAPALVALGVALAIVVPWLIVSRLPSS
jgi:hypothetical protein